MNAKFNTHHDLAAWWRGHLNEGNNRANFFQSVTRELGQEKISGHLRLRNGLVVLLPYIILLLTRGSREKIYYAGSVNFF